jgi:hypothetical protein
MPGPISPGDPHLTGESPAQPGNHPSNRGIPLLSMEDNRGIPHLTGESLIQPGSPSIPSND